jgi:hypothetical protein
MMIITKRISILFLIFIAASCKSIILNDINSQLDKQQILSRIQGTYVACNPTASPSFWRLDTVTVNGSNLTNSITIANDASCANAVYTYVSSSVIDFAEYENKISNIFNLGLKSLNVELAVFSSYQEGRFALVGKLISVTKNKYSLARLKEIVLSLFYRLSII